jgi:hypothetical protein
MVVIKNTEKMTGYVLVSVFFVYLQVSLTYMFFNSRFNYGEQGVIIRDMMVYCII